MDSKEAIEVLKDKNTTYGTLKCDDVAWRKLQPAIDAAVEALERQIDKKPIIKNQYFLCPCCNSLLAKQYGDYDNRPCFCDDCGQALDWGES